MRPRRVPGGAPVPAAHPAGSSTCASGRRCRSTPRARRSPGTWRRRGRAGWRRREPVERTAAQAYGAVAGHRSGSTAPRRARPPLPATPAMPTTFSGLHPGVQALQRRQSRPPSRGQSWFSSSSITGAWRTPAAAVEATLWPTTVLAQEPGLESAVVGARDTAAVAQDGDVVETAASPPGVAEGRSRPRLPRQASSVFGMVAAPPGGEASTVGRSSPRMTGRGAAGQDFEDLDALPRLTDRSLDPFLLALTLFEAVLARPRVRRSARHGRSGRGAVDLHAEEDALGHRQRGQR